MVMSGSFMLISEEVKKEAEHLVFDSCIAHEFVSESLSSKIGKKYMKNGINCIVTGQQPSFDQPELLHVDCKNKTRALDLYN